MLFEEKHHEIGLILSLYTRARGPGDRTTQAGDSHALPELSRVPRLPTRRVDSRVCLPDSCPPRCPQGCLVGSIRDGNFNVPHGKDSLLCGKSDMLLSS